MTRSLISGLHPTFCTAPAMHALQRCRAANDITATHRRMPACAGMPPVARHARPLAPRAHSEQAAGAAEAAAHAGAIPAQRQVWRITKQGALANLKLESELARAASGHARSHRVPCAAARALTGHHPHPRCTPLSMQQPSPCRSCPRAKPWWRSAPSASTLLVSWERFQACIPRLAPLWFHPPSPRRRLLRPRPVQGRAAGALHPGP
jgi:hypothetical protein